MRDPRGPCGGLGVPARVTRRVLGSSGGPRGACEHPNLSPLSPCVTSCRGGFRGGPRFAAIEDEYSGPKLEDGKVTLAFMKDLMQWYKEQKKLHRKCAYQVPHFSQNPPQAPRWGRPRPRSATCPPLCVPPPCPRCPFAPADPGAGEGGAGQAAHLGRNDAEGGGCPPRRVLGPPCWGVGGPFGGSPPPPNSGW